MNRLPAHSQKRAGSALAVVALLLVHYALALSGMRLKSPVFDETAHITAGYTFWNMNDYRLQPENGNLPQRLAALPLVLSDGFAFPGLDQEAWRKSDVWTIGDQFFHRSGNDLESLLRRSRAGMALLGAALCLTVFLWARGLYGTAGGFIALVLCAFSPMILANGPLATSDMCATLFFLLSAWSLWRLLGRVTLPRALACATALSALALSKTSAFLIVPMAALMVPAALRLNRELVLSLPGRAPLTILPAPRRLAAMIGALLLCAFIVWGAIWVAFGCRYSPAPPEGQASFQRYYFPGYPIFTLAAAAEQAGAPGRIIGFIGRQRLLPEAFLYGTAYVLVSLHRYAFLNGELSTEGWKLFFPYCFLVKSTIPLLLLAATALVLSAAAWLGWPGKNPLDPPLPEGDSGTRHAGRSLRKGEAVPVWILLAVCVPAMVFSTINLGARHMLPVYPAIFILLGGLARRITTGGLRWGVLLLLCWHAVEGFRGYPHYLAYFNQITGRRNAYRHLVDSSLDWGQDLPGLKAWLDERRAREPDLRAYLFYFGTGEPDYYGIAAEPLELQERSRRGLPPAGSAGTYCVSATNLQTVYFPVHGRWNSRYEEAYQELLLNVRTPERIDTRKLQWLQGLEGAADRDSRLRLLGSARLLAFLREREPDASIGYSILCYDLTLDDVNRAFQGPPPEMALPGVPGL